MANLTCAVGAAPHFRPTVRCTPFKGQQVEAKLEVAHPSTEEIELKASDKGSSKS
jgi:hypothetical protein